LCDGEADYPAAYHCVGEVGLRLGEVGCGM
jgi:hypothetical protein